MTEQERKDSANERYQKAGHAIQTGVKFEQEAGSQDGTPKHLRVGINLRAVDHAGLVYLLIAKGVITELEYLESIANEAEQEKARYEYHIKMSHGLDIKLG